MSLRSLINNAIMAGIILASVPMAAMEVPKTETKESSWYHKPFDYASEKLNDFKKKIDPTENVNGAAEGVNDHLRNVAKSAFGPIIFALVLGAVGLYVCDQFSQEKTGMGPIDKILGWMRAIFGKKAFQERAEKAEDEMKKNGDLDGAIGMVNTANEYIQKINTTQENLKKAKEKMDEAVNPFTVLWNDIKATATRTYNTAEQAAKNVYNWNDTKTETKPETTTNNNAPGVNGGKAEATTNNKNGKESTGQGTASEYNSEEGLLNGIKTKKDDKKPAATTATTRNK